MINGGFITKPQEYNLVFSKIHTARGFAGKTLATFGVIVMALSFGLHATPASATRFACGSWCNGQPAAKQLPGSTVTCRDDTHTVATGYPTYYNKTTGMHFVDGNLKVELRYSYYCQTMWLRMTNIKPTPTRAGCYAELSRFIPTTWNSPTYSCASNSVSGDIALTPMVNDASQTYGQAASAGVTEEMYLSGHYYPAAVSFNY